MIREVWLLWDSDKIVEGVHSGESCVGYCTVHRPSNHLLVASRIDYDPKTHCFVRVCDHGRTHIDPDEAHYWTLRLAEASKQDLYKKATEKLWSYSCPDCDCGCCDITRKVFT